MISVSYIIVNYFSEKEIKKCINSIHDNTKLKSTYEIVVVSNSPINAKKISELTKLGRVKVVTSSGNYGFASGCNLGAANANGKYLFFLNPDTRLLNNTAAMLRKFYEKHSETGIVAPLTFKHDSILQPTIKNEVNILTLFNLAFPFLKYFFQKKKICDRYTVRKTKKVPVVNGSAIFISHKFYKDLGGMDENFFMYWEENDLCLRTWAMGKEVWINIDAKIKHTGAVTTSSNFHEMFLIQHISKKLFIQKHFPNYLTLNRIVGIIGYGWRTIAAVVVGNTKKIKQFYLAFKWYTFSYKSEDRTKLIDTLSAA